MNTARLREAMMCREPLARPAPGNDHATVIAANDNEQRHRTRPPHAFLVNAC
jgi:hypothetical protein